MSFYYIFVDFEFMPWKCDGSQMRDVISAGYVVAEAVTFDVVEARQCSDTPLSINLTEETQCPFRQCKSYDRIMRNLRTKPLVKEALLDQLFSITFNGDFRRVYEHLVDPNEIIDEYIHKGVTIVMWNGGEDMKILRALLGGKINQLRICNVSCHRERGNGANFLLSLREGDSTIFSKPFLEFPKNRGDLLNLGEAHAAVCGDDHGPAHDPLVDSQMTRCLLEKTDVFMEMRCLI